MTGHCGNCGARAELHVGDRWNGCAECQVAEAFVPDGAYAAGARLVADRITITAGTLSINLAPVSVRALACAGQIAVRMTNTTGEDFVSMAASVIERYLRGDA
jgi:hypothetical protein